MTYKIALEQIAKHVGPSYAQIVDYHTRQLEQQNARLQMELDASCNAEELRQVRAENVELRNKVKNQRDRIIFLEGPTNHAGGFNKSNVRLA